MPEHFDPVILDASQQHHASFRDVFGTYAEL
jgi:hypothetical protein